jgi:hypothetical protein
MAMMPIAEEYAMQASNDLTPQQRAIIMKTMYDESKGAAKGLYKFGRNIVTGKRKKRARRRARRAAQRAILPPPPPLRRQIASNVSARPARMAGNAMTTPIRQSYLGLAKYNVAHREYVADVNGSVNFAVSSFRINPANHDLFPWLSRIALNFEKYRFKRLCFCLKTQTSTTTPGSVMMAIDYDPSDAPPLAKSDLLQYEGAIRGAAWDNINCQTVEKQNRRELLTAVGQSSDSSTKRLEDYGTLVVASQGQANAAVVSELWVEYDLDLLVPSSQGACSQQVLEFSQAGDINSNLYDLNSPILTGITPLIVGNFYGFTATCNIAGNYNLLFKVSTSGDLTVNGDVAVNAVSSTTDVTSTSVSIGYALVEDTNFSLALGDAVIIRLGSTDAGLVNGVSTCVIQHAESDLYP